MMFLDCPAAPGQQGAGRCGLPAEVRCRFTMRSTGGPLDSVMIRCAAGHYFSGPIDLLAPDSTGNHDPGAAWPGSHAMPLNPANHFVVAGAGIDGAIDTTSMTGQGTVSLTVDGRPLRAPSLETTREGIVVRAIHEEVPDSHTLVVTVSIPQVNLDSEPQTGTRT
jgi:hypothetical protein